ncbi:MAG: DUF6377 domain-containing protein [Candidatus Amulumruptor caecigallinarius]|nr:DUF6377 domain-containing protein [Candidatus Amulumruptor caecigallinarius]
MKDYYAELDDELQRAHVYDLEKSQRITSLKQDLNSESEAGGQLAIIDRLIKEYESYISDSALHYIDKNIKIAESIGNDRETKRLVLRRIEVLSHAGLFEEASDEMKNFKRQELDSSLLESYYYVNCGLYQYMSEYINDQKFSAHCDSLKALYTDSIMLVSKENSFRRVSYVANALIESGKYDEAISKLLAKIKQYDKATREYAILASILANGYKTKGDNYNFKKYLTLSAISDVMASTKENMSFRELSQALFDEGDLDHAKIYLHKSFDDANFFSARMRNAQSARMLPVIDVAYNHRQEKLHKRMIWLLALASGLTLILAVAIIFILKQMRSIHRSDEIIRNRNEELSVISHRLRDVNKELAQSNDALKQSDSIKEEYAGLFMQYSSLSIKNLEHYQQLLHNLVVKKNMNELIKKIENYNVVSQTLKDFYSKFDEAILNMYPNFVDRVNSLLQPDAFILVKGLGKLNTELRILALIRIGIADSDKIAQFLRCSLTTVYTYRSKIKNKAVSPETFEQDIMKILSA